MHTMALKLDQSPLGAERSSLWDEAGKCGGQQYCLSWQISIAQFGEQAHIHAVTMRGLIYLRHAASRKVSRDSHGACVSGLSPQIT